MTAKDIHYVFFGNVVKGKSALFRLVMRNGFAHFVRKVFARRKLLPGKFGVFAPLGRSQRCAHKHQENAISLSRKAIWDYWPSFDVLSAFEGPH